jgi:hypothetical protein
MKEDRRAVARERPLWRLRSGQRDAHQSKTFGSGIPIIPPAPNTWTLNILPLGQFRPAPRLSVKPIHIA